jgi:hypothetical protein
MTLDLTKIPDVMDAQRWFNGATLLRKWFSRLATVPPSVGSPDTGTITMDWVLGFPRAKGVYNRMFQERIWTNTAAKQQIAQMLGRKGLLSATARRSMRSTYGRPISTVKQLISGR